VNARKALGVIVGILAVLAMGYYVWTEFARQAEKRAAARRRKRPAEVVPVNPVTVSAARIRKLITLTGDLQPTRRVRLASKVAGQLVRLRLAKGQPVEEGLMVKKGARLVEIDHGAVDAQVAQARAALAAAKKSWEVADVQCGDCERERERAKNLYLDGKGPGTRQMLDRAETAHLVAQARRAHTAAQVVEVQAALQLALVRQKDSILYAPMAGVITKKFVDEGNFVALGAPIVTLDQIDPIEIVVHVPQRYRSQLREGNTLALVAIEGIQKTSEQPIHRIHPRFDLDTRTVPVEIRIPNPKHRLEPGSFAVVKLVLEESRDRPVVSIDALVRRQKKQYLFVIAEDPAKPGSYQAFEREVTVGIIEGDCVSITSGVAVGERIVTGGQQNRLQHESAVTIATDETKAEKKEVKP